MKASIVDTGLTLQPIDSCYYLLTFSRKAQIQWAAGKGLCLQEEAECCDANPILCIPVHQAGSVFQGYVPYAEQDLGIRVCCRLQARKCAPDSRAPRRSESGGQMYPYNTACSPRSLSGRKPGVPRLLEILSVSSLPCPQPCPSVCLKDHLSQKVHLVFLHWFQTH